MAKAQQDISQPFTFVKGLVTEQPQLSGVPDAMVEGDNLFITQKGAAELRRGIDYEVGYALTPVGTIDGVVSVGVWESVAGVATENLVVVQIGTILYFFSAGSTSPSANLKLALDFADYCTSVSIASSSRCSFASIEGGLMVANAGCDPLYIEFDTDEQELVVVPVELRIRDFNGIPDGLRIDERPATLSASHLYNLKNQGWLAPTETDPVDGTGAGGTTTGGGDPVPPDIDRLPIEVEA